MIDDHSRVAYVEICADEKADTAIGVLRRAVAWFADRGVTVERVLSDNGSAYKSNAWRDACAGTRHHARNAHDPYRPQTNGKIERFHRTLADGWAYARFYAQKPSVATPSPAGSTSTITTGATPQSEPNPSADSTTCLDILRADAERSGGSGLRAVVVE